jgi:hypothetical protein
VPRASPIYRWHPPVPQINRLHGSPRPLPPTRGLNGYDADTPSRKLLPTVLVEAVSALGLAIGHLTVRAPTTVAQVQMNPVKGGQGQLYGNFLRACCLSRVIAPSGWLAGWLAGVAALARGRVPLLRAAGPT